VIDCLARLRSGEAAADQLIDEMDRARIGVALVRHDVALRHDPERGNALAAEVAIASGGRLAAIGVVAPLASDPARIVRAAVGAGVRGFWLGSAVWRGRASERSVATDALLAEVARAGLPLLVPVEAWGDATAIGERTAGLGIAVILVGAHYDHVVDDLAAAERHAHLHLEMSRLAHFDAVRIAVARLGAERLLLGTGLADRPPSAPVNAVAAADIPLPAKQAILGGNAARLFGLDPGAIEVPGTIDAGSAAVDVHAHLPPAPWDVGRPGIAELFDRLGGVGIGVAVASSLEGILVDMRSGNAAIVEACAEESRLRGYLVADPNDLSATHEELARHGERAGIVGVKVHCQWSEVEAGSGRMAALFELLAAHGRPVKIHLDGERWDDALRSLAGRHPDLPIIAAHGGPGAPSVLAARVAAEAGNVHVELASSFADLRVVREIVATCGIKPILLGTDAPLLEPAWALGTYADAGLRSGPHAGVFGDSAAALFGLRSAVV
jgi:uncharacterized protein